ncbi:type II toxin-antitoxin system death-on-curing family toxin [Secundilactobacillus hailunensis]|uniref:Type II toxin-antitoxin system death-on-curing family toxin n=1 Tax=Secundilactobacillus hailunensis TaxID=2559923 RepID=A0ABW1T737_9LACO|nr:type II toxin-antitoxin system death-on-curing family toxin [Secundilactobacillus hailunensis]
MRYLTADELVAINSRLVLNDSQQPGVNNIDQLDKIIAVPQSTFYDQSLREMVANKTGFLMESIISGKPFLSMNLQTAMIAVATLADLNDYHLTFTNDEFVDLVNRVNQNNLEATDLFGIFNSHLKQK